MRIIGIRVENANRFATVCVEDAFLIECIDARNARRFQDKEMFWVDETTRFAETIGNDVVWHYVHSDNIDNATADAFVKHYNQ